MILLWVVPIDYSYILKHFNKQTFNCFSNCRLQKFGFFVENSKDHLLFYTKNNSKFIYLYTPLWTDGKKENSFFHPLLKTVLYVAAPADFCYFFLGVAMITVFINLFAWN